MVDRCAGAGRRMVGVVGAAKSCDQEDGAAGVFAEVAENAQSPVFGFFGGAELESG
jgi:hypothetical protein